jgi:hypothetical protein
MLQQRGLVEGQVDILLGAENYSGLSENTTAAELKTKIQALGNLRTDQLGSWQLYESDLLSYFLRQLETLKADASRKVRAN